MAADLTLAGVTKLENLLSVGVILLQAYGAPSDTDTGAEVSGSTASSNTSWLPWGLRPFPTLDNDAVDVLRWPSNNETTCYSNEPPVESVGRAHDVDNIQMMSQVPSPARSPISGNRKRKRGGTDSKPRGNVPRKKAFARFTVADLDLLIRKSFVRTTFARATRVDGLHAISTLPEERNGDISRVGRPPLVVRIYLIPNDLPKFKAILSASRNGSRTASDEKRCSAAMKRLLQVINCSEEAWEGKIGNKPFEPFFRPCKSSLCLNDIYNDLPSPRPDFGLQSRLGRDDQELLQKVLSVDLLPGMKTELFAYQKNSVWKMIVREAHPTLFPDPQSTKHFSPEGSHRAFFSDIDGQITLAPPMFMASRGGIVCEDMGTGKTCICIALILATRDRLAVLDSSDSRACSKVFVPLAENESGNRREGPVPSLLNLCLSVISGSRSPNSLANLETTPARLTEVERRVQDSNLLSRAERTRPFYLEYEEARMHTGRGQASLPPEPKSTKILMSGSSLVVVPDTLVIQWQREISKHTEEDVLRYICISNSRDPVPDPERLITYDLVLMSASRFARECDAASSLDKHGVGGKTKFAQRESSGSITPPSEPRLSSLLRVHWTRIIVDEGHNMGGNSRTVELASKIHAQSRWVVSGTPTQNLTGLSEEVSFLGTDLENGAALPQIHQDRQDLNRLSSIFSKFLRIEPFVHNAHAWPRCVCGRIDPFRLQEFLLGVMVRNRKEDVERDVVLPPISRRVVTVEPGRFGRLVYNCLLATFVVNVVTSEEEHQDYIFHASNRKYLGLFLNNLRAAHFYFVATEILKFAREALGTASAALKRPKFSDPSNAKAFLRLRDAKEHLENALNDSLWSHIIVEGTMGYLATGLPHEISNAWSVSTRNDRLPEDGSILPGEKIAEIRRVYHRARQEHYSGEDVEEELITGGMLARRRQTSTSKRVAIFQKGVEENSQASLSDFSNPRTHEGNLGQSSLLSSPKSARAFGLPTPPDTPDIPLPLVDGASADDISGVSSPSPLDRALLRGAMSAKLNYIMDAIVSSPDDKFIIFSGILSHTQNTLYWLAEALDIMKIPYLCYVTYGLNPEKRAQYAQTFQTQSAVRVLLMDLELAGRGLNLCQANRVIFIEPIWHPDKQAQAEKRAHRIGQTQPVLVETLTVRGSFEENMLQRRNRLTKEDLKEAASPQDDREMREVLQGLPFLSLEDTANDAHETGLDDAAPNSVLHIFSPPRPSIPLVQPSSQPRFDSSFDCQKHYVEEDPQEKWDRVCDRTIV